MSSVDYENIDMSPPPIVICNLDSDSDDAIKKSLNRMLSSECTIRRQKGAVYFYTKSKQDYDTLIQFLEFHEHGYYTYRTPWDNTHLIVLKGHGGQEETVKGELKKRGIKCLGVHVMSRRPQEVDSPALLLTLAENTDLDRVKKIKRLGSVGGLEWFDYEADRFVPLQCLRCQRFKHDSRFCYMPPNCNRCGEEHFSKDCKNRQKAWKCFNCKGAHSADDADCPKWMVYKDRLVSARRRAFEKERKEQSLTVATYSASPTQSQYSFAKLAENLKLLFCVVQKWNRFLALRLPFDQNSDEMISEKIRDVTFE